MLSASDKADTQVILVTGGRVGDRPSFLDTDLSSTEVRLSSGKSLFFCEIGKQNDFTLSARFNANTACC